MYFDDKKSHKEMFIDRQEYKEVTDHLKVGTEVNLTYSKVDTPERNTYKQTLIDTFKKKRTSSAEVTKKTINQDKNGKQLKAKSKIILHEYTNNRTQNTPKTHSVSTSKPDIVLKSVNKKDTGNLSKPGSDKVANAGKYLGDKLPVTDMPYNDVTLTVEDLQMLETGNHLMILSYMRSGSSMNGNVFKDGVEDFNVYEPLIKFAPYHYFTENRLCRMRELNTR